MEYARIYTSWLFHPDPCGETTVHNLSHIIYHIPQTPVYHSNNYKLDFVASGDLTTTNMFGDKYVKPHYFINTKEFVYSMEDKSIKHTRWGLLPFLVEDYSVNINVEFQYGSSMEVKIYDKEFYSQELAYRVKTCDPVTMDPGFHYYYEDKIETESYRSTEAGAMMCERGVYSNDNCVRFRNVVFDSLIYKNFYTQLRLTEELYFHIKY